MDGKTIIDFQIEMLKVFEKYYRDVNRYVKDVKVLVRKHDPVAKVMLFGSYVKGSMRKDSDIDVLIVTDLAKDVSFRVNLRMEIAERIGDLTPFEIHIVTFDEYENWYKKFIDKWTEI